MAPNLLLLAKSLLAALLQHSSPFELPLSSDSKYIGHDRSFSNLASYPANDYPFSSRRGQTSLTNSSTSTLTLPANPGIEYNAQPLLSDAPYHASSQLQLSPPNSVNGSTSGPCISTLSPFAYYKLPKPYPSHASTSEHFSCASGSLLSSNWGDSTMTGLDRSRISTFPPTLSPPLNYTSANGMSNAYLTRSVMDRGFPPYHSPAYLNNNGVKSGQLQYPYRSGSFGVSSVSANGYAVNQMPSNLEPPRQDGPPFSDTNVTLLVVTTNRRELRPEIAATIQKGFFQVDGKWTCYRRNYFTVCCSFGFKHHMSDGPFYLQRHGRSEQIHQFSVSISAKTAMVNNQDSEPRGLVQHTPKRDKATESVPQRHPVQPAPVQSLQSGGNLSTGNNPYSVSHSVSNGMIGGFSFEAPGHQSIPTAYTFERIQFQKATANNGKRRAQQQYFHIVVELSANISRSPHEENWIVIATKESDPMVVRGRSPGHYKDNARRDSQTSMDPDRGAGHGSDSASGSYPFGPSHNAGMDWQPGPRSQHQHHYHHCGGSTYHAGDLPRDQSSDYSPTSATSSTTLTGSPTDIEFPLCSSQDDKSSCLYAVNPSEVVRQSDAGDDIYFSPDQHRVSRKRPLEDDSIDDRYSYRSQSGLFDTFSNSGFEVSAVPHSKVLCASS